ncbi:hypothetical protein [Rickettsia montanensis]|uniref:hypothetical protein n=1 Tax=Rickettsia montanensis TaxID=33991 RepID=UPI00059DDEBE|nr:hypothetical protein [Rickettsia montanensis]
MNVPFVLIFTPCLAKKIFCTYYWLWEVFTTAESRQKKIIYILKSLGYYLLEKEIHEALLELSNYSSEENNKLLNTTYFLIN